LCPKNLYFSIVLELKQFSFHLTTTNLHSSSGLFIKEFKLKLSIFAIALSTSLTVNSASASSVQGVDPHEQKKELKAQERRSKLTTLEAFPELQFSSWYCAQYPKSGEQELKNLKKNLPTLLPMQLKDITAAVVERCRAEMLKGKHSNATVKICFTTLKSVMSRAVEWDIIEKHDLRKVKSHQERKREQ